MWCANFANAATTSTRWCAAPRRGPRSPRSDVSSSRAPWRTRRPSGTSSHPSAAMYEVGIPSSEHRALYEAKVIGTENVLRAVLETGVGRVVYISTVGAFGNTKGQVVDESYQHPGGGYTSYYEETKVEAHRVAKRLIDDEGLPCVIVQPGGVYGPDRS